MGNGAAIVREVPIDPRDTVTLTCPACGLVYSAPRWQTQTRGARPCGWSH